MRFRWVPVTSDSIYPFLIGLFEFMLVEALGPGEIGLWFILMALIFAAMTWIAHANMRRARKDADNEAFFRDFEPARLRDFYRPMVTISLLALTGIYLKIDGDQGPLAMLALMAWQFFLAARFRQQTVTHVTEA